MKKVAVILAGCGVFDGSEIYESVLTLLRIEQNSGSYQCMAPNIEQLHVIDHLKGEEAMRAAMFWLKPPAWRVAIFSIWPMPTRTTTTP